MGPDVERLRELLAACHRVLPHLRERNDRLAETIRATCIEIEQRLAELGAVSDGESRA
jgi:hypothetical protein